MNEGWPEVSQPFGSRDAAHDRFPCQLFVDLRREVNFDTLSKFLLTFVNLSPNRVNPTDFGKDSSGLFLPNC
jgi:hypothetical protein